MHETLKLNSKPDSIWDIVRQRASEQGDKTYLNFIDDGEIITYRLAAERAELLGKGLLELGIGAGSKLGLVLKGSALHVYAWYCTLGASLVDVPINPDFRGALLDHAISKIEVSAAFADAEGLQALATAGEAARAQIRVLVIPDHLLEHANAEANLPAGVGRILSVSQLEQIGRGSTQRLPEVDPRGLASIRFSSGTTGLPKGVMMDHGHMLASARKFNEMMDFGSQDTLYSCFPFHHVFATITGVLSTMCCGGSMVVARKFSANRYWQDIRQYGVTRAHILDPLIPLLMKQPPGPLDRQHRVPILYTAAGHYPEFEERFGVRILALYDMSELTVALHYPPGQARRPGSCGKESGLFDVLIVDEHNCEVPPGTDGEIVVRPRYPSIMFMGYYNDADQAVEKWRDLWFHTGDRGRKDADGYYYFLGRLGDRIRRRGVNISAEQIEAVALQNPVILECAAIAVPSSLVEDDIKLCVRLAPGHEATPSQLAEHLASALPRTMTVRYVEIMEQLPKTQTEKVQRAELRKQGQRGLTAQTWDHEQRSYVTLKP